MGDLAYFLLSSPLPLQSSRILKSKEVTISRKCRFTRSFHKDQVLHFTCVCIRVFTRVRVRVCMRVYNRLSENSSRYIYEQSFADSGFSKAICRLQVYRDIAQIFSAISQPLFLYETFVRKFAVRIEKVPFKRPSTTISRERRVENRSNIYRFVRSLALHAESLSFFLSFFSFFPFKRTFSSYERMENGTRIEIEKSGLYVLSSYDVSLKLVRGIKLDFTLLHFEFRARDCSFNIVGGLCLICRNKSVKFGEPIYYT